MKRYFIASLFFIVISIAFLIGPLSSIASAIIVPAPGGNSSPGLYFTLNWVNECTISGTVTNVSSDGTSITTDLTLTDPACIQDWDQYGKTANTTQYFDNNTCQQSVIGADAYQPGTAIIRGTINYQTANGGCAPDNLTSNNFFTIGDDSNADIVYYEDSGTIYRADGNTYYTFTQDSSNSKIYLSSGEQPPCVDRIVVTGTNSATLWEITPNSSSGLYGSKEVPPSDIGAGKGCVVSLADDDINGPQASGQPDSNNICISNFEESGISSKVSGQLASFINATCSKHPQNKDGSFSLHLGTSTNAGALSGGGNNNGSTGPSCESSGGPLSWIFCAAVDEIANAEHALENVVDKLLKSPTIVLNPSQKDDTHTYTIWSNFRIFGNIILVIALLAAVIVEAIGGGVSEAYTVKRMLPRILVAAILINLSIYFVAALVDITNILGQGINGLISQPFQSPNEWKISVNGFAGGIGFFGLVGAGAVLWAGGGEAIAAIALFVGLPVLMAVLGVLFTLMIRQGILIFLILISPVAFALYTLPNTEQYFKKWWDLLFKTLLVYPIVSVVFAMSNVTAVIMSSLGVKPDWLGELMGVLARVAPLFLIPFAFKMAGGIIGSVSGAVANIGKKTTEAIKGNPNRESSLRNKVTRRLGQKYTEQQYRAVGSRNYEGKGIRKRTRRAISKTADLFGNVDARIAGYNKAAAGRREDITTFGDDSLVFAGAGYSLMPVEEGPDGKPVGGTGRQYFNSKGVKISKQLYDKGKTLYGGSQHDITQSLNYTVYKCLTDDDKAAMKFAFNKNAEEQHWTEEQIKGNWLGATFQHKGQHGSIRYEMPTLNKITGKVISTDMATNSKAYHDFLKDTNISRPSFRLSEVTAKDWAVAAKQQRDLEMKAVKGNASGQDLQDLAMTYELFDAATHELQTIPGLIPRTGTGAEAGAPQVTASGASAAAAPIIEAAKKDRAMELRLKDASTMEKELIFTPTPPPGVPGPRGLAKTITDTDGSSSIYTSGVNLK